MVLHDSFAPSHPEPYENQGQVNIGICLRNNEGNATALSSPSAFSLWLVCGPLCYTLTDKHDDELPTLAAIYKKRGIEKGASALHGETPRACISYPNICFSFNTNESGASIMLRLVHLFQKVQKGSH